VAFLIGITGNSGCGQSTAASYLKEHCSGICSLDSLGHRLLNKDYVKREIACEMDMPELAESSSEQIRKVLGKTVFQDPDSMRVLNRIMHLRMRKWVAGAAAALSSRTGTWVLEGALIFELELDRYLSHVVTVAGTFQRCCANLAARDGITEEDVALRWRWQLPMEEKIRRADRVLKNSLDLDYLRSGILTIFQDITEKPIQ